MRTQTRECARKINYGRWSSAERAARNLRRWRNERVHVYRCKYCGGVHVGQRGDRV